jgi:TonB family protein
MKISLVFSILFLLHGAGLANAAPDESAIAGEATFPAITFVSIKESTDLFSFTPRPKYPAVALRTGICGAVAIAVKIGLDGKVLDYKIIKSDPFSVFDKAVTDVIGQWRFRRITVNGEPVIYQTKTDLRFRVDELSCSSDSAARRLPESKHQ